MDFYDIKAYVQLLLNSLGLTGFTETEFEDVHLTESLKWNRGQQTLAYAGKVKSGICQKLDLKADVWYAVLEWKEILNSLKRQSVIVNELTKFPVMRRDLALIVEKSTKFADIAKIANKTAKPLLKELNLFDVYENQQQLGEGKKSYAIGLIFEQTTGTLKDQEVDALINEIINACKSKLGAVVRT
jgi:phenylalanyl-tRNA synthetase beta chain